MLQSILERKQRKMKMWLRSSDVKKCKASPLFFLSSTSSYVKLSYVHCSEQGVFTPSISAGKYTALYHGILVHLQEVLNKEKISSQGLFIFLICSGEEMVTRRDRNILEMSKKSLTISTTQTAKQFAISVKAMLKTSEIRMMVYNILNQFQFSFGSSDMIV